MKHQLVNNQLTRYVNNTDKPITVPGLKNEKTNKQNTNIFYGQIEEE